MSRVLLGFLAMLIGGACLVWSFATISMVEASADWPTMDGVVSHSQVERRTSRIRGGGYNVYYDADIRYRYRVDGEQYESGTFVIGAPHSFGDSSSAQAEVDAYPVGRSVTVYYSPDAPEQSALVPEEPPAGLDLLVALSALFVVGGAILLWTGLRAARDSIASMARLMRSR